jgi:hypothetical protein
MAMNARTVGAVLPLDRIRCIEHRDVQHRVVARRLETGGRGDIDLQELVPLDDDFWSVSRHRRHGEQRERDAEQRWPQTTFRVHESSGVFC